MEENSTETVSHSERLGSSVLNVTRYSQPKESFSIKLLMSGVKESGLIPGSEGH